MRAIRILAAAAWYERERSGLGTHFQNAIEAALDILEQEVVPLMPVAGESGARGAKRLLLRRFPYSVIVREDKSGVVVIAFAHHSRRPGYWRDRSRD